MADLTSVARVKQYAPLANSPNQDARIASLVSSESATLLAYLNIVCPYQQVTNRMLDGRGGRNIVLPLAPVIGVSAVSVLGTEQANVSSPLQSGFMFDPSNSTIMLTCGRRFPDIPLGVVASWEAGFRAQITTNVPAPAANTTLATLTPSGGDVDGGWMQTVASITGNSTTFTVAANQSNPLANQYGISDGTITFNSANSNQPVTITGYYVPGPLLQAVNQMVALGLQQSVTVGVKGKNIGGDAISYDTRQMSDDIKAIVGPYRRMAPGS